jgi:hypothetical protein
VHRQLRSSAGGRRVNVVLHCPSTTLRCAGSVRLLLVEPPGSHRGHLHKRPARVVLAGARFGPGAGVFTVTLRLDAPARSLLAHSRAHHLALMIEITAGNTPRTRVIPVRVTAAR